MDEMQALAEQALRELLDNPERDDWDDLLAANRAPAKPILIEDDPPRRILYAVKNPLRRRRT
jgi:hypothetical protein